LKQGLLDRLKQVGAFDVRIADPSVGYEHALQGRHPLDLWDECRSVVVFALACPPKTNNTYLGPYAPWEGDRKIGPVPGNIESNEFAMDRLARMMICQITLKGMQYIEQNGRGFCARYSASGLPGIKLSAYEAGLGVYGRAGFIIHPVLGSHLRLGGILTDAVLEPDGRLEGFKPCEDCDRCIKMCPAKAFDPTMSYPQSYTREHCMKKRAEIAEKGFYCHNCYAVCPAGSMEDGKLLKISEAKSFYKPHRESR
jgi:epoxyqueuosine reductase QueG